MIVLHGMRPRRDRFADGLGGVDGVSMGVTKQRGVGPAGGDSGTAGRAKSRGCQPPATEVIAAAASSGLIAPPNSAAVWSLMAPPTSGVKN